VSWCAVSLPFRFFVVVVRVTTPCHRCHERKSLLCKGVIGVIGVTNRVMNVSPYCVKVSSVSHIFHTLRVRNMVF